MSIKEQNFRATVLDYYTKHGRKHLPWRETRDPYLITVSEIMLQQTQVERVIPKFEAFVQKWSETRQLAAAPLSAVLTQWQGLGYNRRAKMLHECAKVVVREHNGVWPLTYTELLALPGVGPYTAGAVMAFAYNTPVPIIETNIRSVYLHHFFPNTCDVSEKELMKIVTKTLDHSNPRQWYAALMDYGVYLKKAYPNPSRRASHHAQQSPFKGSDREIRGAIVRFLSKKSHASRQDFFALGFTAARIRHQLDNLISEKLIAKKGQHYILGN